VSDKHKLLFTGHSRDLTSNPGIWIHKLARWHTRQADITHCMPTVLISVVLRCKTQCDYVRTLQSTPGSGLEAGNTQAHLRYLQLLASLLVILLFSSACLLGQASVCIMTSTFAHLLERKLMLARLSSWQRSCPGCQ